ncbi:hypothetical protein QFC21_001764 [Naganishia friedmannii]|uniref:Uncharacterized protein n=1 Tax=Naganishia friedmannii TaxID=89922 RepID=A0ACC2W263_9TREE|nr:hypothetical protein QFC21_001764 [Naganishia friedmannii]
MSTVPVLHCPATSAIRFLPPPPPPSVASDHLHPLEDPQISQIDPRTLQNLQQASHHLHASRLVAFPTETVYGLGANTLDPVAVARVYELKGRPQDNPLIVHVSSLRMLRSLLPHNNQQISDLYLALINAFWPGPLTLLFPAKHPQRPPPAPQTLGIRLPAHPLARALITVANVPISAPSANSSGRPSPTRAEHVFADLGSKGAVPVIGDGGGAVDEVGMLGCILDAGACDVGVESTVLDGTSWTREQGGQRVVKVLRPGGVGVEEIERVVRTLDDRLGLGAEERTRVWVYGRDPPLSTRTSTSDSTVTPSMASEIIHSPRPQHNPPPQPPTAAQEISNPSTPGMKYKHYSPSVPVYLIYPTNTFPSAPRPFTSTGEKGGRGTPMQVEKVVQSIASQLVVSTLRPPPSNHPASETRKTPPLKFGVMAFTDSPLARAFSSLSPSTSTSEETTATTTTSLGGGGEGGEEKLDIVVRVKEFGRTADDAARALFRDMLAFEGTGGGARTRIPDKETIAASTTISGSEIPLRGDNDAEGLEGVEGGVDAIIIEACSEQGVGLAVMERINKAVGGGGTGDGLASSSARGKGGAEGQKRFWVRV